LCLIIPLVLLTMLESVLRFTNSDYTCVWLSLWFFWLCWSPYFDLLLELGCSGRVSISCYPSELEYSGRINISCYPSELGYSGRVNSSCYPSELGYSGRETLFNNELFFSMCLSLVILLHWSIMTYFLSCDIVKLLKYWPITKHVFKLLHCSIKT
jgi:hypothetical protein